MPIIVNKDSDLTKLTNLEKAIFLNILNFKQIMKIVATFKY